MRRTEWVGGPGLAGAALAGLFLTDVAQARVQHYQIVRLLNYKSNCVVETIEDRSLASGPLRFHASCENVTFYPEGVAIVCDDRDDDRSCKVETVERRLDQLQLLQKR